MGFLKSLQKITKATVDVAMTPVEVVKDIATAEWAEEDDGYTARRLRKAKKHVEEAYDELDED